MWKKENYASHEIVTFYTEQEYKELEEKNKNIRAHKDFLFKENDRLMRNNSIIRIALNEIKDITTNALAKQRPYKEDFIEIQDIINKTFERKEVIGNRYENTELLKGQMNEVEKMYENAGVDFGYNNFGVPNIQQPFTAEKQLELIKKLGNINIDIDNGCYMSSEILKVEARCDTFEETLAEFVNNLWQSLTEEERKQVKEILE